MYQLRTACISSTGAYIRDDRDPSVFFPRIISSHVSCALLCDSSSPAREITEVFWLYLNDFYVALKKDFVQYEVVYMCASLHLRGIYSSVLDELNNYFLVERHFSCLAL